MTKDNSNAKHSNVQIGQMLDQYESFLKLQNHIVDFVERSEWKVKLHCHTDGDILYVTGRGALLEIYRVKNVMWIKNIPSQLNKELIENSSASLEGQSALDFDGWQSNTRLKSDIEYRVRNEIREAIEQSSAYWNGLALSQQITK